MNERFEELALQAEIDANELIDNNGLDPRQYPRYFAEKFAELIVRECVGIVNSLEQYEGQGDCSTAEYIKEHFGVEE